MRTYKAKNGKEFRLSAIYNESVNQWQSSYFVRIFWIETKTFETFSYSQIEPYL